MFNERLVIVPDDDQIKGNTADFFWHLFMPYMGKASAHIEVRCLPIDGGRPWQKWFPVTHFKEAADFAVAQAEAWSVYMGVLPRVKGGGKAEHVRLCSWLWCDIDGGEKSPIEASQLLLDTMAKNTIPAPHMIVISGGGCHCYWRLSESAPCKTQEQQEAIRRVLKRLVLAIGGTAPGPHADSASTDPARILRVPGSWNHKQESPRYVWLRCLNPGLDSHDLDWWKRHLPSEPHPAKSRFVQNRQWMQSKGNDGELYPQTAAKLIRPAQDGSKHMTMREVAVASRKKGFDAQAVRNFTEQVGWVSGVDMNAPQQIRHLDALVDWTMQNVMPDPGG